MHHNVVALSFRQGVPETISRIQQSKHSGRIFRSTGSHPQVFLSLHGAKQSTKVRWPLATSGAVAAPALGLMAEHGTGRLRVTAIGLKSRPMLWSHFVKMQRHGVGGK
eukprot:5515028-Amphidinium_carterae.1